MTKTDKHMNFRELFSCHDFEITMISAVLLTGNSFELNYLVIQIKILVFWHVN